MYIEWKTWAASENKKKCLFAKFGCEIQIVLIPTSQLGKLLFQISVVVYNNSQLTGCI